MRVDHVDVNPAPETLIAVVLGALLATISVIAANQLEAFFRRRERERGAALLVGEVLSTLRVILVSADAARKIGDPYGPVTRRMLKAARREVDIYDRNREALLDLRDHRLRVDIHSLMVRLAMPLDGILDGFGEAHESNEVSDQAFDFMLQTIEILPNVIDRLGRVARYQFGHFQTALRPGEPGAPRS